MTCNSHHVPLTSFKLPELDDVHVDEGIDAGVDQHITDSQEGAVHLLQKPTVPEEPGDGATAPAQRICHAHQHQRLQQIPLRLRNSGRCWPWMRPALVDLNAHIHVDDQQDGYNIQKQKVMDAIDHGDRFVVKHIGQTHGLVMRNSSGDSSGACRGPRTQSTTT